MLPTIKRIASKAFSLLEDNSFYLDVVEDTSGCAI
jgi:hypothetical protein